MDHGSIAPDALCQCAHGCALKQWLHFHQMSLDSESGEGDQNKAICCMYLCVCFVGHWVIQPILAMLISVPVSACLAPLSRGQTQFPSASALCFPLPCTLHFSPCIPESMNVHASHNQFLSPLASEEERQLGLHDTKVLGPRFPLPIRLIGKTLLKIVPCHGTCEQAKYVSIFLAPACCTDCRSSILTCEPVSFYFCTKLVHIQNTLNFSVDP
jgi:hypothetical protein